jgi:hypothetical protein
MIPDFQPSDFESSFSSAPETMFGVIKMVFAIGTGFLQSVWGWMETNQAEVQALFIPLALGIMAFFLMYMAFRALVSGMSKSATNDD